MIHLIAGWNEDGTMVNTCCGFSYEAKPKNDKFVTNNENLVTCERCLAELTKDED